MTREEFELLTDIRDFTTLFGVIFRSASMRSAVSEHDGRVFCWLHQLDIISHVNLTFSFTN